MEFLYNSFGDAHFMLGFAWALSLGNIGAMIYNYRIQKRYKQLCVESAVFKDVYKEAMNKIYGKFIPPDETPPSTSPPSLSPTNEG